MAQYGCKLHQYVATLTDRELDEFSRSWPVPDALTSRCGHMRRKRWLICGACWKQMGQSCTRAQQDAFFMWSEQKLAFFNAKDEQTPAVAKARPAARLLAHDKHREVACERSRTRSRSRGSSALSCPDVSLRVASDTEILQELLLRLRRNR